MTACPTDDLIGALADGVLSETERSEIETHLARCPECASVLAELAMLVVPSASGTNGTIGRYELAESVGAGGMGIVVEAFDPLLSRRVAIKIVRPDKAISRARVLAEARALAVLSDPHILTIHDVIDSDRGICLVTELVDGENAEEWRKRCRPTWSQIRTVYLQVARGLNSVHGHGLLHRDIKPANIFVGRDGRPRIGDFGLVSASTAATGGTVGFMPPEQVSGSAIDVRADEFALAMSMIHAVHGTLVPAGTAASDLPAEIPHADRRLLARAIATRPDDRFERIGALIEALEQPTSRRRTIALVAGGLAAIATVSIGVRWLRDDGVPRITPPVTVASLSAPTVDAMAAPADASAPVAINKTAPRTAPTRIIERAAVPETPTLPESPAGENAPSTGELEREMTDVMGENDARGCSRVLAQLVALDPRYERQRPYCEMLAGHCKAASAMLEPSIGLATAGIVNDYCPADGDITEQRAQRAVSQATRGRSPAACAHRATWVTSLAVTPADAELFALNAVECFAAIRQCDAALAQAGVLGKLRGTTADAELARIAPNCGS